MQIYYNKFKKQFPNVTKEEYESIYNFLEKEGFISTTRRGHHEIYSFFEESKKNYPKDIANKCAEMDTAQMFDISRSLVRQIKSFFVTNY